MKLTPIKPIFDVEISRGAIQVGSTSGEPPDPPDPEPPVDAIIEQDFRDLPGEPAGWTDDGSIAYDEEGIRTTNNGTYGEIAYTWPGGALTEGTIVIVTTQNFTNHAPAYAALNNAGDDQAYVSTQGPGLAEAARGDTTSTITATATHGTSTIPVMVGSARWSDTADTVTVDLYDNNEPDSTDTESQTKANFTPTTLTLGAYRVTGDQEAVIQYVYVFDRRISNEELGVIAAAWVSYAPPPPTPGDMLVGASVAKTSSQTWTQATSAFETMIGEGCTVMRRFTTGKPGLWSSKSQFTVDNGIRDSIVSFKGDPTQAEIEAFFNSIPNDGFTRYVAMNHEVENDGGTHTPAWFKGRQDVFMDAYIAVGSPAYIRPTVIYMFYLEHDGDSGTSTADFFPNGDLTDWVMGLDPYDTNGVRTMQYLVEPTLDLWRAAGGVEWLIAETGTQRQIDDGDAAGEAWIEESCDWLRSEGCIAVCWWNETKAYDWRMDDYPLMLAAWGAEVTV